MKTIKLNSRGAEVKTLQFCLNLEMDGIFGPLTDEAVRALQKANGLVVDGIVGPKTWAVALRQSPADYVASEAAPHEFSLAKTSRPINRIILHCSATPEGKDFTVEDITRWHKARGWTTIGYHYVIYRDGRLFTGRDINKVGAHTSGYNTGSIGVCYIGGISNDGNKTPKDTRTPEQKETMRDLVRQLQKMYPGATVHGHYEFAKKACPCFKVPEEM